MKNPSPQIRILVVTLEIQKNVKCRDLFTSSLKFLQDDTRYSNLEQVGTKGHVAPIVAKNYRPTSPFVVPLVLVCSS